METDDFFKRDNCSNFVKKQQRINSLEMDDQNFTISKTNKLLVINLKMKMNQKISPKEKEDFDN